MSSFKRGGGQASNKGKNIAGGSSYAAADQLTQAVQDVNLDDDGNWEVISKKNKNKPGNGAPSKQWAAPNPKPNAWGGRGNTTQVRAPNNNRAQTGGGRGGAAAAAAVNYMNPAASNAVPPPLERGWNWNARPANAWQLGNDSGRREKVPEVVQVEDVEDDDAGADFDGSDDELLTDEYDSDESPKSHEARKKNKWYSVFFETLDSLTVEQINEPTRQWHCPACQNGPGAIDWYRSLPSLVTHAKTKGSKRVKIHRDLAEILEEELRRRGATVVPAGESYGQWKGLNEVVKDKEIVWPPMVVIRNTQLEEDENDKWLGMGNQELLDYFGSYEAVRARHSYGPKGHRGMSVLIFESSAVGYTEAERLSKHFEDQGTDRYAWDHKPNLFYPGGKRQLYGYLATKKDLEVFNQHSHGKTKLKFEVVSYQERVVNQLKQMNEDNQQLNWYKNKIVKEKMHSKAVEESLGLVSQKLRKKEEEHRIVRDRTHQHHQQTKEEMDYQEQFFKDQIKEMQEEKRIFRERTQRYHEQNKEEMDSHEQYFKDQIKEVQDGRNAQEALFDKLQEEERIRVDKRDEKIEEMKEFEEEREKLMKKLEEKKAELKRQYWEGVLELEQGVAAELTQLMEKHTPKD